MLLIESEFIINFQVYYGRWKIFQIFWYFSNSKYQIIESILKLYDIWLKMISSAMPGPALVRPMVCRPGSQPKRQGQPSFQILKSSCRMCSYTVTLHIRKNTQKSKLSSHRPSNRKNICCSQSPRCHLKLLLWFKKTS